MIKTMGDQLFAADKALGGLDTVLQHSASLKEVAEGYQIRTVFQEVSAVRSELLEFNARLANALLILPLPEQQEPTHDPSKAHS